MKRRAVKKAWTKLLDGRPLTRREWRAVNGIMSNIVAAFKRAHASSLTMAEQIDAMGVALVKYGRSLADAMARRETT